MLICKFVRHAMGSLLGVRWDGERGGGWMST